MAWSNPWPVWNKSPGFFRALRKTRVEISKTFPPEKWTILHWPKPRCFAPVRSLEDCLRRTQLSRACRRTWATSSGRAADFFEAAVVVAGAGRPVRRPKIAERVDHEGELGVVIAKNCHQPAADEDVRPYILGYTCVNDVTARDLQKKDGQWTRAKGFDTFCPVGPLVTNEIDPWAGIGVETRVNGAVRQQGNTRDFIFPLDAVIRYISQVMTLLPGDLIPSGTPQAWARSSRERPWK